MELKILGTGCKKCRLLEQHTRQAVEKLGLEADIEKVEDIAAISEYNILQTPALVVDGEVRVSGKIPSARDIVKLLSE